MNEPLDLDAALGRLRAQEEGKRSIGDIVREIRLILGDKGYPMETEAKIQAQAIEEFKKLRAITFHAKTTQNPL